MVFAYILYLYTYRDTHFSFFLLCAPSASWLLCCFPLHLCFTFLVVISEAPIQNTSDTRILVNVTLLAVYKYRAEWERGLSDKVEGIETAEKC